MPLVIAAVAAVLLSILAAAIAGFGLLFAFGQPLVVALPLVVFMYVALWIIIPLCLIASLACTAPTLRDLPLHIAAIVLAGLISWVWYAVLPGMNVGDRALGVITFGSAIAPVLVHWAAFLFAQRKRRASAAAVPVSAPGTVT